MRKLIVVTTLLLLSSTFASADLVPIGDPYDAGSWLQQWEESGTSLGNFDSVAIRITGNVFEVPGIQGTLPSGWSKSESASLITIAGPKRNGASVIGFYLAFGDEGQTPDNAPKFSVDEAIFFGNTLLATTHVTYKDDYMVGRDGATGLWQWKFYVAGDSNAAWNPTAGEVGLPLPGALLLGAIGLGLVGWVRKRVA